MTMNGVYFKLKDTLTFTQEARVTVAGLPMIDICFIHELKTEIKNMATTFVQWKQEEKERPWNWIEDTTYARQAAIKSGAMFFTTTAFSEQYAGGNGRPEPIRYGDLCLDFDDANTPGNALSDVKKLAFIHLPEEYNLDPHELSFYASGGKGFHLIIPAMLLGATDGDQYLPLIYKRMVADWKSRFDLLTLDMSIYCMGRGRMFRVENVKRSNGRYKVPLTLEEVRDLSIEEIEALTENPRTIDPIDWALTENEDLSGLYHKTRVFVHEELKAQQSNQKPLSDEEVKRLSGGLPPCIKSILTNFPSKTAHVNFNKLVMLLINYFQTAGISREDATEQARPFLEGYADSASYKTAADRFNHWHAMGDYLFGNEAYGFDCKFVLGLHLPGSAFDCQKCALRRGPVAETISCADANALTLSRSTPWCDDYAPKGSLIEMGMRGLVEAGAVNIPQLLFPIVVSHIARATNGFICCQSVYPSFAFVKVAGTSVGKTKSNQLMTSTIKPIFDEKILKTIGKKEVEMLHNRFYGPDEVASGQALLKAYEEKPRGLCVFDEITGLFSKNGKTDPIGADKRRVILTLATQSGLSFEKRYANDSNSFVINDLLFNMIGNATPVLFDNFTDTDLEDGTIQRLFFQYYDGPIPDRASRKSQSFVTLSDFGNKLKEMINSEPSQECNLIGPPNMPMDDAATKEICDFSLWIVNEMNAVTYDGEKGIIGRAYENTLKFAMIHAVSTHTNADMFSEPITRDDILYGKKIALDYLQWQRQMMMNWITSGEFDSLCEVFKSAILAATRIESQPNTGSLLVSRRRKLKNVTPSTWQDIVRVLKARGEIAVDEIDGRTIYSLIKK